MVVTDLGINTLENQQQAKAWYPMLSIELGSTNEHVSRHPQNDYGCMLVTVLGTTGILFNASIAAVPITSTPTGMMEWLQPTTSTAVAIVIMQLPSE